MTIDAVDKSQRTAAKVAACCYLFAMALSMFAEGYIGGRLIVPRNAADTARNILAHELLFRIGIACSLIIVVSDVTLITALYVILKRVGEPFALVAAFLRLMGTALYAAATLNYVDVLRILGSGGSQDAFGTEQLQAMARLSIGSYSAGLGVSFIYLGLGSAMFGYVWLKSNYVPKALAGLGVLAPLLLAVGSLTFVLLPTLWTLVFPAYMVPLFIFEVGMGLWLLVKGLRDPK